LNHDTLFFSWELFEELGIDLNFTLLFNLSDRFQILFFVFYELDLGGIFDLN